MRDDGTPSHWPDKQDLKEISAMMYGDGSQIERGHVVHIPSEPGTRLYRVLGLNPSRGTVVVLPAVGGCREVASTLVSRW